MKEKSSVSESSNQANDLNARYTQLRYYKNGWQPWVDTTQEHDYPYYISQTSPDSFTTYRNQAVQYG